MKPKKIFKRATAVVLASCILAGAIPTTVLAGGSITDRQIEQALKALADNETYPNGVFAFLEPRLEVQEGTGSIEFAIIRAGNTDKEATVKFKAVDVSADYGDDYKIAVPGWFSDDELKVDEDSGIYKQQLKDAQDTPAVFDGKETPVTTESETSELLSATENQDTAQTGTPSEIPEESSEESVLSPTDEVGMDLQSAKELLTDEKTDKKLWTEKTINGEDSGLTAEELSDAYNDTYSDLPGAECELTFAPGETYKKLKFIVVDDDKSEDDEIAMLVLTDAKGADLVDNPSGLINIKDNDESEKSEFVIDEDEIIVKPNEDSAILTIRRTKGISHYGEATISTASDTAESGIYYNSVSDTLSFSAEQEYRKIEIPIIKHPESGTVSFNVRVDESDSAKIVIQSNSVNSADNATVNIVRYAPFALNTADDTTFDNVPLAVNAAVKANEANETINYWKYKKIGSVIDKPIIFRYQAQCLWYAPDTISMSGVLNYDLANYSPGTYYDTRWWFFGSEGYYKDFYTYLYLNGKTNSPYQLDLPIRVIVNKAGTIKNNCKGDYYLTDSDRQKATSIKYGTWYEKDTKDTDARFYYMDLYGIPIRIRLISGLSHEGEESGKMKRSDEDSWLHTKTYTSPTDYERTKDKDAKYIGGLSFEDGSGLIYKEKGQKETTDENIFYKDDVITVKSDFTNSQLSEKERENIYLWGVKIKSIYTDYGYYYVEGNQISVNDLYQGKLKGYHVDPKTGKITYGNVPVNKTNYNEKFQGHNAPLFEIYPVYRQKTATIQFNIDNADNITIAEGTFKDGDIMTIGKLDTINYSVSPKDKRVILGYEWYANNYKSVVATSDNLERELYSKLYDKNANAVNKDTQKSLFADASKNPWRVRGFEHYTSGVISVTPADLYVENKSGGSGGNSSVGFVNLKLKTRDSVINMAVNPAAYPEYQNKVIVSSADPETGKALTAKYTGTYKKVIDGIVRTLCEGDEIKINGYSMSERYNFFPTFKNEVDSKKYKVVWNDRTGDTNRDGNYSAAEKLALGEYYDRIEKNGMSGDYFTFVSDFPMDRQLYYSVVPKVPSDVENVISGTVYYNGKSVLDNTNGKESTKTPASGVEVVVNGMTTVTDDNGNFKFTSKDFSYNEIYNVIFNNGSSDWSSRITVGCPANVEYDEYNTFNVTNLQAYHIKADNVVNDPTYTATEKNPDTEVYNDDNRYLFTFTIDPVMSGFQVGKSEAYLYAKDGTLKKTYEVKLLDAATKKYAISPKLNNEKKKSSGYYSFNPAQEGIAAGDYLTVRVFDQKDIGYIEHKLGFSFKKYIGAIAIINSFEAPYNGIIEYLGKADAAFDLGVSTAIEDKVNSLVTITTTIDEETDELVKNISYGWSKNWKGKYDSSKKKKEKPEDEAKALVKDESAAPPAEEESKEEESKAEESSGDEPAPPPADVTDADKSKEAQDLVEDSKDNKKSAKLTSNYKLDLKIAFSLKMRYNEEKESWYFDDFVIVATLSGEVSAKYSYATPVGISIYVTGCIGGDITGIIGVERYENNKLYFQAKGTDDDPRINLADSMGMYGSDRKLTFYGGLRLKPYISLGVGAELPLGLAKLELNGKADFDMYFDTRGTREGSVKLSGKLILELLFGLISKEYSLGEYKYNMFETSPMNLRADGATYSRANNLLRQNSNDARYEVVTEEDYSDALTNNNENIKWNGKTNPNGETTLQKIVYTDAEPYVESIIGNRQFMVWVDDNIAGVDEEGYNISSVAYSICENGVWSEPEIIDKVSETAITPYMYKINDSKLLILWSSTDMSFEEAENNLVARINSNSIKGCFFDADTNTFSKIDYITKNTSADRFADHTPNVAYYETNGKKYLMVSYFKEEYQQAVSDEEVTVGDLLNPYKTIAYRFYDFENEKWIDSYMGDAAERLKVLSPSQRETFEENWYGQNFADFAKYVYVDESRISDGNGYWNEKPTSDEVKLTGIGKDYLILSFDTIGYKDKVISAYCIDIDGNTETTNDRDIFVKVYDYGKNREYNAIRITNDNREQGSDVRLLYDSRGGVNLFYVDNGNFVEYDVKQLIDNGFTMKSQDGTEVWLFDKSDSDYNKPETVVEAKEGKPISGFSAFTGDDGHIYVMWTEYGVTYKDGIDPNSDEATKPENQLVERQISIIANSVDFEEAQLYDKDGNALVYPEKDKDGNIIDYNAVQDINGLKAVVKAGDLILKNVRTETWTEPVTLTDEKGANYSGIDATVTSDNVLRFVYLKNMSMVLTNEKSGEKYAGIDKDNPELCTADFDLGKADYSLKFSNIEDIISGQKNTPVAINVTNNNVALAKNVKVQLYIDNELVGSNVISKINGGATVSTVINCDIPESIDGKVMKAVVLDDGKEIKSIEETLTYADNWALENVDTEFIDRNTVKLTATVYNNGEEKSSGLIIHTELNGKETTDSKPFDLEIGETKTVEWTVPIKDSDFESSTLDDGTIQEKASITVKSMANDIDTAVIRSATKEQTDAAENIKDIELSDLDSGEKLSKNIKLGTDKLLGLNIKGIFNSDTENELDVRYVSSDESVVKIVNDVLQPVSKGKAEITVMYAPKSDSILCMGDNNSVTIDNWNEIPSSLIKTKTITVEVVDAVTPDEPSVEPSEPSTEPSAEPSIEPSAEPSQSEPTSSDIPTNSTEPANSDVSENTSNSQSSSTTNTGDATPLFPLFITVLVAAGLATLCFTGKRKSYRK